ncbi:MAG: HNH endonuclease signature motif containing protein [Dehalococcoidia bacterium]
MHVHHIDGDVSNNSIENLELISKSEHARLHYQERFDSGNAPGQSSAHVRWRESEEGKRQLRSNAKKMHANTQEREFACANCGELVRTKHPTARFCHQCGAAHKKEKSKERGKSRRKVFEHVCPICGRTYYRRDKPGGKSGSTCGYKCGWELRRQRQTEGLQSSS